MASFTDALEENPAPRRLGDVWLRYEPGRLLGESQEPTYWRRELPGLCLGLAGLLAVGALVGLGLGGAALGFWGPGVLAALLAGLALRLESHLGRRRFVLHFRSERLRLERLRWSPGATRVEWVAFDEVTAVEVVERPAGGYSLVVVWRPTESEKAPGDTPVPAELRRAVLVEHIGAQEQEALLRVWRMLHNAFGLRGAGLAGE